MEDQYFGQTHKQTQQQRTIAAEDDTATPLPRQKSEKAPATPDMEFEERSDKSSPDVASYKTPTPSPSNQPAASVHLHSPMQLSTPSDKSTASADQDSTVPASTEQPSAPELPPAAFLKGLKEIQEGTLYDQAINSHEAIMARAVLQACGYTDWDAAHFKVRFYKAYRDGRLRISEDRFTKAHLDEAKALKAPLSDADSDFADWKFEKWFSGHRVPPPEASQEKTLDSHADAVNALCWHCFD